MKGMIGVIHVNVQYAGKPEMRLTYGMGANVGSAVKYGMKTTDGKTGNALSAAKSRTNCHF